MKWKISSVAGLLKFTSALTIIRMKEWRKMEMRFGQLIAFLESAHGEFLNVCINLRSARVVRTCLYFSNSPIDFLPLCLCQFMPVDILFTFPPRKACPRVPKLFSEHATFDSFGPFANSERSRTITRHWMWEKMMFFWIGAVSRSRHVFFFHVNFLFFFVLPRTKWLCLLRSFSLRLAMRVWRSEAFGVRTPRIWCPSDIV